MAFIRLPLVLAGSGIAILAYQLSGNPVGIAAGLGWSTFTLTAVNLICFGLLAWRSRVEGFDMKEMLGFHWRSLGRDLLWGVFLSFVLGGLLLLGVFGAILLLKGPNGFTNLQEVFMGSANFSFNLPPWLAVISAGTFPLLNPAVEELQYRGYAQPGLIQASGSVTIGTLLAAFGFSLQHLVFAVTATSALAYVTGFFLWGLGAGWVARRQGRLAPLVIAHFISNLSFGIIPLLIVFGGASGTG
jgi:membrane protease YdiL (CAAX protease family)